MNKKSRHIIGKSGKVIKDIAVNGFEDEMSFSIEDTALFCEISDYMRARLDIEAVKNDPALAETNEAVKVMISEYQNRISGNKTIEKFIKEILSEDTSHEALNYEISQIEQEIRDKDVDKISAEWVQEWQEKKKYKGSRKTGTDEISEFITGSLKPEEVITTEENKITVKKAIPRSLFIKYISFSAAALIAAMILIRTLLPSSDPGKIFDTYYTPFNAKSPVTRSLNNDAAGTFASAILSYKSGDYQSAVKGFSEVVLKDPFFGSAHFFLGLTNMALGNYYQAIDELTYAADNPGEYGKETQWYLGLSYLRTGNSQKATECFENLTRSAGFYRDRSEKILRLLK